MDALGPQFEIPRSSIPYNALYVGSALESETATKIFSATTPAVTSSSFRAGHDRA